MPAMAVRPTIVNNHLLLDPLLLSAQPVVDVNIEIGSNNI